jgi:hypothetical protein
VLLGDVGQRRHEQNKNISITGSQIFGADRRRQSLKSVIDQRSGAVNPLRIKLKERIV